MTKNIHKTEGSSALLLEMPHSGTKGILNPAEAPNLLAQRLRFSSEAVRASLAFGCDRAVPTMTNFAAMEEDPKVSTLSNDLSRIYTDPNRDKNTDLHRNGVIWTGTVPRNLDFSLPREELETEARRQFENIFTNPLTDDEFKAVMAEVYDPYHAEIQETHQRLLSEHGKAIHLSLHTFPPVLGTSVDGTYCLGKPARRGTFDLQKGTFPDLILIHNNFKAAAPEYVEIVRRHFEAAGLIVQDGFGPFLGNNGVTGIYGNPDNGVHVIGIEHIPHGIELGRHENSLDFDENEAQKYQEMYSQLFQEFINY